MFLRCSSFVQDFLGVFLFVYICLQIMANSVTVGLGLAVMGVDTLPGVALLPRWSLFGDFCPHEDQSSGVN